MEKYSNGRREPLTRLGVDKVTRAKDNLTLDVLDAERLGYGPHYGNYKADHPNTAEANRARLGDKPKRQPKAKRVYEFFCLGCGCKFTTTNLKRRYCGDGCKSKTNGVKFRAKRSQARKGGKENV